jgi:hypothetical protein
MRAAEAQLDFFATLGAIGHASDFGPKHQLPERQQLPVALADGQTGERIG